MPPLAARNAPVWLVSEIPGHGLCSAAVFEGKAQFQFGLRLLDQPVSDRVQEIALEGTLVDAVAELVDVALELLDVPCCLRQPLVHAVHGGPPIRPTVKSVRSTGLESRERAI